MFYTLFPVPNHCLKPAALNPPWASIPGCSSVLGLPQQITKHRATYIIRHLSPHSPRGWKVKVKVKASAGLVSPEASLFDLQTAVFSL